jgi:Ca2+-binding EF-hand superfamily protein
MDDDQSGTLDIQEFWKAINDFRVRISQDECRKLFDLFDENKDGDLNYDELILNIKGEINPFRQSLIKKAFTKLDDNKNGFLEASDVKSVYNAAKHPDVIKKKKTEEEVLQDFLETFEAHRSMSKNDDKSKLKDGRVTFNEFLDYYSNVSSSIDDDKYFELMITNAWNLDNKTYGKGFSAEY